MGANADASDFNTYGGVSYFNEGVTGGVGCERVGVDEQQVDNCKLEIIATIFCRFQNSIMHSFPFEGIYTCRMMYSLS